MKDVRMTKEQADAAQARSGRTPAAVKIPPAKVTVRPTKKSKYMNEPIVIEGFGRFDSRGEAERFLMLRMMERDGAIANLRRQVAYALTVDGQLIGSYVADFVYDEIGVRTSASWKPHSKPIRVVEDFKSPASKTDLYLWKKKHLLAEHGIKITETGCA